MAYERVSPNLVFHYKETGLPPRQDIIRLGMAMLCLTVLPVLSLCGGQFIWWFLSDDWWWYIPLSLLIALVCIEVATGSLLFFFVMNRLSLSWYFTPICVLVIGWLLYVLTGVGVYVGVITGGISAIVLWGMMAGGMLLSSVLFVFNGFLHLRMHRVFHFESACRFCSAMTFLIVALMSFLSLTLLIFTILLTITDEPLDTRFTGIYCMVYLILMLGLLYAVGGCVKAGHLLHLWIKWPEIHFEINNWPEYNAYLIGPAPPRVVPFHWSGAVKPKPPTQRETPDE